MEWGGGVVGGGKSSKTQVFYESSRLKASENLWREVKSYEWRIKYWCRAKGLLCIKSRWENVEFEV